MQKSVINCDTLSDLVTICAWLVSHGVTFTADATTRKITMTGGY
jgi:hypothetical protein